MRKEGKKEVAGRRRGEEISLLQLPQPPTVKPATQPEMAHSVCMLEGLTSIKKGSMSETLAEPEIKVWI